MKILIAGASGFLGRHLMAHLLGQGHEIEAWSRHSGQSAPGVLWRSVDLLEPDLPVPSGRPWDAAFHLAAHTRPSLPWSRALVLENLDLCARFMEHLAAHAPGARCILPSSAHVYASSPEALREEAPCDPEGPYGLSKLLCEQWARTLRHRIDLQIVRAFNQVGPGMPSGLLLPDLVARVQEGQDPLQLQGRDDVKDFLDVRDALRAYEALLRVQAPSGTVWNLCSGRAVRVSEVVRVVLEQLGTRREVHFASPDTRTMVGDHTKLQTATGWTPRHGLDEMVAYALGVQHG
ncbi:MAG TPA: NAD(P)-dependent oxidoreductase [Holophagaceae bacterium]|nr:NAD(P)-dependent oxidoreductase [Holophagaceae bacterium]